MAYDAALADRIRDVLAVRRDVTERRMFGGLAFMARGNMAVCAVDHGRLMVRLAREDVPAALEEPGTEPMTMSDRTIRGWVLVSADAIAEDRVLQRWVERGVAYCDTLPAK